MSTLFKCIKCLEEYGENYIVDQFTEVAIPGRGEVLFCSCGGEIDEVLPQASERYIISAEISKESSIDVGYVRLQKSIPGVVIKTLVVCDSQGEETGIHIDFDAQGRLFGIEVMRASLLPPEMIEDKK